jgi:hypothetical protein
MGGWWRRGVQRQKKIRSAGIELLLHRGEPAFPFGDALLLRADGRLQPAHLGAVLGELLSELIQFEGSLPGGFLIAGAEDGLDTRFEDQDLPLAGNEAFAHRFQVALKTEESGVALLKFLAQPLCFVVQLPPRMIAEEVLPQMVDAGLHLLKKLFETHHPVPHLS